MEFKGLQQTENELPPMPVDLTENKSGRFISLSVMLHAALVATVALMSVPPIEFPKKEVIEFEVESETTAAKPIADGTNVPETKGEAAPAPAPVEPPAAPAPVAKAAPVAPPTEPAESVAPKIAPVVAAPKAVAAAPKAVAAAPATLDDISTPDLETLDTGEVAVAQMDEKDLQDDFEKVDRENRKAVIAAKKSIESDADKAAQDGDDALREVEQENQALAKSAAQAEEARRKADVAAIAAAEAKEKAAADKAARLAAKQAADREASEARAAAAREAQIAREGEEANARLAALKEAHGKGTADEGEGTGNSGSPAPTKEVAGIPGGVRSLEQLRQMPGNKFPQYSQEERLARQEGQTMFYAYVNKDGSLSQFKLGQSTGYRNLDSKTLAALKKWKFYPGQEGWVEMPFKWTLNGEALEAGGQLRK
ncbi:MAG: TonB family protein [Bdellovibrionales bacterium]|nr:TonB family protein [Bdellovibrionales bacterium]